MKTPNEWIPYDQPRILIKHGGSYEEALLKILDQITDYNARYRIINATDVDSFGYGVYYIMVERFTNKEELYAALGLRVNEPTII